MPKTSSIALLVWRLTARDEPSGDGFQNSCSGHCLRKAPNNRFGPAKQWWL